MNYFISRALLIVTGVMLCACAQMPTVGPKPDLTPIHRANDQTRKHLTETRAHIGKAKVHVGEGERSLKEVDRDLSELLKQ